MKIAKLISLVSFLILVGSISASAKEVVIYVSGPWIYAQAPNANNRVVVFVAVAPNSHLPAQIFPGDDYSHPSGKPTLYQGFYNLDLPQAISGSCKSAGRPYQLKKLGITISSTVIQNEVVGHSNDNRVAVSLPIPACYIEVGHSESMVGTNPTKLLPPAEYTTLMALHYFVNDGPAHLSGTSDDKTITLNDDIAFVSTSGPPALSLVTMAIDTKSARKCDSYSHDSLDHSRRALGLGGHLFAEFPELKSNGIDQNKGKYNKCAQAVIDRNQKQLSAAIESINSILNIRAYIADPSLFDDPERSLETVRKNVKIIFGDDVPDVIVKEIQKAHETIKMIADYSQEGRGRTKVRQEEPVLERTENRVIPYTVGGGDCHMAQISVEGIVP